MTLPNGEDRPSSSDKKDSGAIVETAATDISSSTPVSVSAVNSFQDPTTIEEGGKQSASGRKYHDNEYDDHLGSGDADNHIFRDPAVAEHWRGVYENAGYENRHRFDPTTTWTADEEKRVLRKIDFRIMIWAWLMFCSMDLHRRNINRAISDNMLEELGMTTNDYNYGQTIFLATFLASELPSGLISKKLGADNWIPTLLVAESIVAGSQAFISTRTHYYVIKVLLGLITGGFIPDMVLWLTYYYKSNELPTRLAWFWTALSTVNIVGSLMAAGILQMRGVNGWSGWQWLFLIEGIITFIIGSLSFGLMPSGPCATRGWLRGRRDGWFSPREETIMVNRLLRDDPSKGDMNNREGVGLRLLVTVLGEWEMWPLYMIGLTSYIAPEPMKTYISKMLVDMGFSTFEANMLAVPSQFLFAVNLLIITWVSRRLKERGMVSSLSNIWIFPWLLALVCIPVNSSPWVRYALMTGTLSYPYCHAILVAWNAKNSNAVRTRAVSAALYNMFVQSGNIIAVNIYREDDRPLYIRGNKVLLAICCYSIVQFYLVKAFYIWRNRVRDARWNGMTPEEQEEYVLTTEDEGLKRLDFRFAH